MTATRHSRGADYFTTPVRHTPRHSRHWQPPITERKLSWWQRVLGR
ncbi:hypothetical protein UFOVP407_25 [uncultured Caudovirales phage]|uniref:Uncharacterized protein n=1 Tax=uncultured Caudovirales phage TaxID=2100421 RepID=A0A6J5M8J4_9CAUD|nr:hypothetical protein UFOVP407_25 [uncultured Caudovirales phage]